LIWTTGAKDGGSIAVCFGRHLSTEGLSHDMYGEDFGRRLQEGLSSIHPDMPSFHFSRRDAAEVID